MKIEMLKTQISLKDKVTVLKCGGIVIGNGFSNLPTIAERIDYVRRIDGYGPGPVIVVSAPPYATNSLLAVGARYASNLPQNQELQMLRGQYTDAEKNLISDELRPKFREEWNESLGEWKNAADQIKASRRFEGWNMARLLVHGYGEIPSSIAVDYILRSRGLKTCHIAQDAMPKAWPIVTDDNFESASFLLEQSKQRTHYLIELLEQGRMPVIAGFVGMTESGHETTFERGGSDRTATDLGILLHDVYDVNVTFLKDEIVSSADPKLISKDEGLEEVKQMSYNMVKLICPLGLNIIDPQAVLDIEDAGLDIPLMVWDYKNPGRTTLIKREAADGGSPVKVVAGKERCPIIEFPIERRGSLRDYLTRVRRYPFFAELTPSDNMARFLFPDDRFFDKWSAEIRSMAGSDYVSYDYGVVALGGDDMQKASGVAAAAFGALGKDETITIFGADLAGPSLSGKTSSRIFIITENQKVKPSVKLIHKGTRNLKHG